MCRASVSVGKIFERFAKAVRDNRLQDAHLAGSAVASLESKEEPSDIDIHTLLDISSISSEFHRRQIQELEWFIKDIFWEEIKEQVPAAISSAFTRVSIDMSSRFVVLNKGERGLPFNILSLSIGDRVPFQITVYCLCREVTTPVRSSDFNSGSLQMRWMDEGVCELGTSFSSIKLPVVLKSISDRILLCEDPEQLKQKGAIRYLLKILKGYTDPDPSLFTKLLEAGRVFERGEERPLSNEDVLKALREHFAPHRDEDSFSYAIALVHLWFLQGADRVSDLKNKAREDLLIHLKCSTHPLAERMLKLVESGKKSELAWLLLSSCSSVSSTLYRGEPSLRLGFVSPVRECYLQIPIKGLKSLKYPIDIVGEQACVRPDPETLKQIEELVGEVLGNSDNYPAYSELSDKFSMKTPDAGTSFYAWYAKCKDKASVPGSYVIRALESTNASEILKLSPEDRLFLLRSLHAHFGSASTLYEWSLSLPGNLARTLIFDLVKDAFLTSCESDQRIMLEQLKLHLYTLFSENKSSVDAVALKRGLKLLQVMDNQSLCSAALIQLALESCYRNGFADVALKLFKQFHSSSNYSSTDKLTVSIRFAKYDFAGFVQVLDESFDRFEFFQKLLFLEIALKSLLASEKPDAALCKIIAKRIQQTTRPEIKKEILQKIFNLSAENLHFFSVFKDFYSEFKVPLSELEISDRNQLLYIVSDDKFLEELRDEPSILALIQAASEQKETAALLKILKHSQMKDPLLQLGFLAEFCIKNEYDEVVFCELTNLFIALASDPANTAVLSNYLPMLTSWICSMKYEGKTLHALQNLHKNFFFKAPKWEGWKIVWDKLNAMPSSDADIDKWIDIELCSKLPLEAFNRDLPFIFSPHAMLRWIDFLMKDPSVSTEFLLFLISYVDITCASVVTPATKEQQLIAESLFLRASTEIQENPTYQKYKGSFCFFCAAFCPSERLDHVLNLLQKHSDLFKRETEEEGHISTFRSLSEPEAYFLCMLRKWQNRDPERVASSKFLILTSSEAFSNSQHIIAEIFKESIFCLRSIAESSHPVKFETLDQIVNMFFTFMLQRQVFHRNVAFSSVISRDGEVVIDLVAGKKKFHRVIAEALSICKVCKHLDLSTGLIAGSSLLIEGMTPEEQSLLVPKLVEAVAQTVSCDKFPSTALHLNYYVKIINHLVSFIKILTPEQKKHVLQALIALHVNNSEILVDESLKAKEFFLSFSPYLTKEQLKAFYKEMLKKIINSEVHPAEADLFIKLTGFCFANEGLIPSNPLKEMLARSRFIDDKFIWENLDDFLLVCVRLLQMRYTHTSQEEGCQYFIQLILTTAYGVYHDSSRGKSDSYNFKFYQIALEYLRRGDMKDFRMTTAIAVKSFCLYFDFSPGGNLYCKRVKECAQEFSYILQAAVNYREEDREGIFSALRTIYEVKGREFARHWKEGDKELVESRLLALTSSS